MSNNQYPPHPGQTEVSPYYVKVPLSEYEALKRENEQLHALLHGVKSQDSNAEIDTLASECRALRSMNAKAQEEIAMLKENQRWRKCSEGLPDDGAEVIATDGDGIWLCYKTTMSDGSPWFQPDGHHHIEGITHWMPMPKAPEVDNESNKV